MMHIDKLIDNANFPATEPSVAEFQAMADTLRHYITQVNVGNLTMLPYRQCAEEDAVEMIRQLSYHIQFLSKGDAVKIDSAASMCTRLKPVHHCPAG